MSATREVNDRRVQQVRTCSVQHALHARIFCAYLAEGPVAEGAAPAPPPAAAAPPAAGAPPAGAAPAWPAAAAPGAPAAGRRGSAALRSLPSQVILVSMFSAHWHPVNMHVT